MNKIIVISLLILINIGVLNGQNVLSGDLISNKDRSPVEYGYVLLKQNGVALKSATSDKKGKYSVKDIPAGVYTVEVVCIGYKSICDTLNIAGHVIVSLCWTRKQKNWMK